MNTILIVGGYGAVGRHAAEALTYRQPGVSVIVAGRNPGRAKPIPGAIPKRVDAADPADLARALDGVDIVLNCVDHDNARIANICLARGIHYLDVTASHQTLATIEPLDETAKRHHATAVLSLGLVPGVTNLLARHVIERSGGNDVRIGVLLGSGEHHGPAAIAWTLDGLGRLAGTWAMRFPEPHGRRTVHRFPFSDQYTLPTTLGIQTAATGLCLDSRLMTAMLAAGGRPAVARLLRHPRVRSLLLAMLAKTQLGSDAFAVTARSGTAQATFSGRLQSRATGLTAALLIGRLPTLAPGVGHIEQLVDPTAFLTELAATGFTLDLEACATP